jgi:hypothetical protein
VSGDELDFDFGRDLDHSARYLFDFDRYKANILILCFFLSCLSPTGGAIPSC